MVNRQRILHTSHPLTSAVAYNLLTSLRCDEPLLAAKHCCVLESQRTSNDKVPGWNLEVRDFILCVLIFGHQISHGQTSTSLIHRVQISCEIFGAAHPDPDPDPCSLPEWVSNPQDLWRILDFLSKAASWPQGGSIAQR